MNTVNEPEIIAIAAIGKNTRAICSEQQLIWRIPDDLKRVQAITLGHPIIMGRKTYDSIGHPLKGRTNIVLTRDKTLKLKGCLVVHSLKEAISEAKKQDQEKIFIFGGAEIYKLAMPLTTKLLLTIVDSDKDGDSHFPEYLDNFEEIDNRYGGVFDGVKYHWHTYVRKDVSSTHKIEPSRAVSDIWKFLNRRIDPLLGLNGSHSLVAGIITYIIARFLITNAALEFIALWFFIGGLVRWNNEIRNRKK